MQAAPVSWTTDDVALFSLPRVRDTRGGSLARCQRCDIPLGAHPCPNLLCREYHGQSAGTLCAWCRQHQEERLEALLLASDHDIALDAGPHEATYLS
jgi:hypothetical protein